MSNTIKITVSLSEDEAAAFLGWLRRNGPAPYGGFEDEAATKIRIALRNKLEPGWFARWEQARRELLEIADRNKTDPHG